MRRSKNGDLLGHVVGDLQKLRRHLEAECLAVLEIGNPLKLRWSLERQVSRFLAHEDEVNVPSRLAKLIVGDKFFFR